MINRPSFTNQEPNYNNAEVQSIRAKLGDFDYGEDETGDYQPRVQKAQQQLENGALYEGEWLQQDNPQIR